MNDRKPQRIPKDSRPQNIDEDLERLDISRLRLLIKKYPEKAKEYVKELQPKAA